MPRLVVFGDSVAAGMGVRGATYAQLVAEALDLDLVDFSDVAMPITHSLKQYSNQPGSYELAIIAHGITEAIPRPAQELISKMPPRWRRDGWMDPRPYYSSHRRKRVGQRIESAVRWRVRNLLLRLRPPRYVMTLERYTTSVIELATQLTQRGTYVILLGPPDIDQRRFPGSGERTAEYWSAVKHVGDVSVDLMGQLPRWSSYCADRFHPNDAGHEQIAKMILTAIVHLERKKPSPA